MALPSRRGAGPQARCRLRYRLTDPSVRKSRLILRKDAIPRWARSTTGRPIIATPPPGTSRSPRSRCPPCSPTASRGAARCRCSTSWGAVSAMPRSRTASPASRAACSSAASARAAGSACSCPMSRIMSPPIMARLPRVRRWSISRRSTRSPNSRRRWRIREPTRCSRSAPRHCCRPRSRCSRGRA